MDTLNNLKEQLFKEPFKDMLFSIYNKIDDDGFVKEIGAIDKKDYGIDDFHYLYFTIQQETKDAIKFGGNGNRINRMLNNFKYYVEHELQAETYARCRIYILKDYGSLIAVKPRNFTFPHIN